MRLRVGAALPEPSLFANVISTSLMCRLICLFCSRKKGRPVLAAIVALTLDAW